LVDSDRLFHKLNSATTPFLFTVQPAQTNETACHFIDTKPILAATVDVQETHIMNARDMYWNLQIHQNDVFVVKLVHDSNPSTIVEAVISSLSDGVYQVDYTLSKAGNYTMMTTVQPNGAGPSFQIKDSPLKVVCKVNLVDASKTTLTGVGVTDAIAGVV
jgi:hypothetical protein